jgi:hypothetical protein
LTTHEDDTCLTPAKQPSTTEQDTSERDGCGFVGKEAALFKSPPVLPRFSRLDLMGLYTILKKHRLKDRQLRLLFLGLDAAGKSTIVARLLSPEAPPQEHALKDISPTLGFKISTIEFENYKLNICISQLAF